MNNQIRNELLKFIYNFIPKNILVLGDLMLDKYTWGQVDRISPEAPIPVLRVENEEVRLGGAASTAANVRALKCGVYPVGLVGKDGSGHELMNILTNRGIQTEGIVQTTLFKTIVKNRFLTQQQQLLRVDHESVFQLKMDLEIALVAKVKVLLSNIDGVIISDYSKGLLTASFLKNVIDLARKSNIPIICDPGRGVDFSFYKRVTTIKPNRAESSLGTGIELNSYENILCAAEAIKNKTSADFITLSLDKDGILLYESRKHHQLFETEAKEVYDVTGAGDMVISIMGIMLASKASPALSIQMSNIAAGLEISHIGVYPLNWNEIKQNLLIKTLSQKIVTVEQLLESSNFKKASQIVFTNGYFDNLSAGHLRFLQEMERFQGEKVVAINSDSSIENSKGKRPLLNQEDRARLLASIQSVTWVLIFDEDNASNLIEQIRPDLVIKGEIFKSKSISEEASIIKIGSKIKYLEHFKWKD